MTHPLCNAQRDQLETITRKLEEVNAAIRDAVDSGLSVELVRKSRHHCDGGYWGDIMMPQVVKASGGG